jgi:hypothetical protein
MICGFLAVAGFQQAPAAETGTEAKNKVAIQAAFEPRARAREGSLTPSFSFQSFCVSRAAHVHVHR